MISLYARAAGSRCFGLAFVGERLVATSAAGSRHEALRFLERSLPRGSSRRIIAVGSSFTDRVIAMLQDLEAGDERHKVFSLATDLLGEPLSAVLAAAARIPIGYVTSYGHIARVSDTEARVVGRVMATNPLYPLVACHRVVGADFSLVGYRGRTRGPELLARLERLRAEARAWPSEKEVPLEGGRMLVYPVERVLEAGERRALRASRQRRLFD
jgi:O-6-methylguanine DNA methyltransferase